MRCRSPKSRASEVKAPSQSRFQTRPESTNNLPLDATNSYKTQLFPGTASVFTCSRINADIVNQIIDKLQKNGGLEGLELNPAETSDAAFVFFH